MLMRSFAQLLMVQQQLFSLPWSISAALLAWPAAKQNPYYLALRVLLALSCVLLARTAGMALNRWIDCEIDRLNPRTSGRPLQVGALRLHHVVALALASIALLVMAAASLGTLFLYLCPLLIALLILYSYTKRFTWACHFVLGVIYACAPILTYLVVAGRIDPPAIWLGLSAGLLIAASDILYALQDIDHDQRVGLYSVPACFGAAQAQRVARGLYAMSALTLLGVGRGLGALFWLPWLAFSLFPAVWYIGSRRESSEELFYLCNCAMPLIALMAVIAGSFG